MKAHFPTVPSPNLAYSCVAAKINQSNERAEDMTHQPSPNFHLDS